MENTRKLLWKKTIYIRGKRWAWLSGETQRDTEELVTNSNEEDVFEKELRALFFNSPDVTGKITPSTAENALEAMKLLSKCRNILCIKEG